MDPAMEDARNTYVARETFLFLAVLGTSWTRCGLCHRRRHARECRSSDWIALVSSATEPGYDLYAQNMAESRGSDDSKQTVAANDRGKRGKPRTTDAEVGSVFSDKAPSKVAAAHPQQRSRTDDSVRVTLGRPESLRVLRDSDSRAESRPGLDP